MKRETRSQHTVPGMFAAGARAIRAASLNRPSIKAYGGVLGCLLLVLFVLAACPGLAGEVSDKDSVPAIGDQWPCWRGPDHNGAVEATGFELDWSNHPPRIAWSAPAGIGFSSPMIFENTVLLFDHQDGKDRLRRWDLFTGDEVWSTQWEARAYREDVRGKYPGPLSTPAYRAGRDLPAGSGE